MNLIKRIHKQGFIILPIAAAVSAIYEWKMLPLSILLGGLLGLVNLRGLAWGLKDFAKEARPSGKVIFLSMFRFIALAAILFTLALLKLINLIGVLIGFTIVFALILKEGLRAMKESSEQNMTGEDRSS
ncbi:MAG: ATP synthase subunit I [Nitrospirota bacterium]